MPKIQLKPNSPEFEDFKPRIAERICDMPGCTLSGECRAPKDRSLEEYYHFCQVHAREYNQAWNFFSDMTDEEIKRYMHDNFYGHRPTWKYGVGAEYIDELYRKAWQTYSGSEEEPPHSERYRRTSDDFIVESTPETDAMKIMGLEPPLTLEVIKKRYKALAKQYHPDINPGNKEAEEKLKSVNMAYTILKLAYGKFEKMDA